MWNEVQALFASPVSDVFSGGIAFSYFPTSDGFGMVTFPGDGTTYAYIQKSRHFLIEHSVQTSDDFARLSAYYNTTAMPTSPAKASVTASNTNCPAQNSSLLASTTLPPTPDESVCDCVNSKALSCLVKPSTAMMPSVVGILTE